MSWRLRVCMVHYSDYHLDSRIQRQARALAERGDEVHLVCLSEPGRFAIGDGEIHIHQVRGEKAQGGARNYVLGYARFIAAAARRVAALSARGGLDLVEAHNMPDAVTFAGLPARLRRTPVILNVHDTFPELFTTKFGLPSDHWVERLIRTEERLSALAADHVIVVTEAARDRLAERGVGRDGCTVVMNSPDMSVFGPPRKPVAPPAEGRVRVLYHGGLAPRFGVETLIRAVGLLGDALPRLELRVCGSGEDRDRLAAIAAEVGAGRIDVAREPVPFREIPGELEAAHIGVVPTLDDRFTELLLPVKLLEYVHMGLPAVASRLPGISRAFGPESVWPFEPGSPESLAAALAEVCRRPDEARRRARAASLALAGFGWDVQRRRYLALVDSLTSQRQRAAVASAAPSRV
jgi:glycosyltransferase involved in cell wall biosynthesis